MTAAEKLPEGLDATTALDNRFLELYKHLSSDAVDKAASCTGQVFEISQDFLNTGAADILKKFYDLYFGGKDIESRKEEMNRDVDDMIDQIKENLDKGEDLQNIALKDDSEVERLGLSALQKQLEGLITMDEGIRQKIIPALATMQFEDAVRQRLEHISHMWAKSFEAIHKGEDISSLDFMRSLGECLSSVSETASYYEIVVKEEPPSTGMDQGDALLF